MHAPTRAAEPRSPQAGCSRPKWDRLTERRRQSNKGLYGLPFFNGVLYRITIFLFRILGHTIWRWRFDGLEKVPKEEPFLLLPNHSSLGTAPHHCSPGTALVTAVLPLLPIIALLPLLSHHCSPKLPTSLLAFPNNAFLCV